MQPTIRVRKAPECNGKAAVEPPSDAELAFENALKSLKEAHRTTNEDLATRLAIELIRLHPKKALGCNALDAMWKPIYRRVQAAERQLKGHAPSCVDAALSEYEAVCAAAQTKLDYIYHCIFGLGNRKSGRLILQKLYVYQGDVHRYLARGAAALHPSRSRQALQHALQQYMGAWQMSPGVGLCSNQIAVAYQARGDRLLAAYFYLRAGLASDEPFPKALQNLGIIFRDVSQLDTSESVLAAFEAAALSAMDAFWTLTRPSCCDASSTPLEVVVNKVIFTMRSYVQCGAMFDGTDMLLQRFSISLLLCMNSASVVPVPFLVAHQRLLRMMVDLRAHVPPDAGDSLSAACEVGLRWCWVHNHLNTALGLALRDTIGFMGPFDDEGLSASLEEDRELNGLHLLWDAPRRKHFSSEHLLHFWGLPPDARLGAERARVVRETRLACYCRSFMPQPLDASPSDDEDDDIIVFTPETLYD